MVIEPLKRVAVEELTPGEQLAVDVAQVGFVADLLPVFGDRRDLALDQRCGFHLFQVKIRRGRRP